MPQGDTGTARLSPQTAPRNGSGEPADRMRRRVLWLVGLRPALAFVILGTGLAVDPLQSQAVPADYALYLAGAVAVLSVVYFASRTLVARWPWIIEGQLTVDVCIISMMIIVSGGYHSDFVTLYVLPILAASVLRRARGGLVIAGYSSLCFGLIVASQYGLVIPRPDVWGLRVDPRPLPLPRYAFYSVGLYSLAFLAVARLTGYLSESLDRSESHLRDASTAIADLQALNQHVIDSMTGGLAATDRAGRVVIFNRAAEAITGLPAARVQGRPATEVLQLPEALVQTLPGIAADSRGHRASYVYRHPDGRAVEIGLTVGPLVTSSGCGYLFAFQDVTELRRLEREAELQKRLAAVGQMAAGIAHEIRNPLASMSGSMQVLRQELALTPDQAQLFDIVLRESERLNQTIRDFLSYARPQQGPPLPVDLGEVVRDAAQLLRNSPDCTAAHRVEVETASGMTILGVEAQMRQIVWNLATNALRAMPSGGVLRLAVRGRVVEGQDSVVLSVSDDGVGIAPEEVDRIFQPFHGGFAKGAGLGLAIVHRIVTEHGGSIQVQSEKGQGTEISITMPRPVGAEAAA